MDPRDPAALLALAEPLYGLAGDPALLQRCINHSLTHWRQGSSHFYSSQSCHLASSGPFAIRINLWPLLPVDPRRRAILADVLSYYDYHDHNFSFITANYFGPGYETEIYSYQRGTGAIYPGQRVDLDYRGRHTLDANTVLLYEQYRDIHMQLPPARLSASLNLMMTPPDAGLTDQFYFDIARGRVRDYVASSSHKRVNALGFARHIYDAQTLALLQEILETHPCSRTRVEAARVLVDVAGASALSPASATRMLRDPLALALWSQAADGAGQ
ncbi:hypothetical protein ACFFTM_09420 [Pseudoduganella plicata]|uniref:hypothetical protein n=1 Tax=Pseudoduganella plicata TaxID=321984 RepID=UPI00141BE288|nr:hypothetical protein [Pseudoduganella plicata]